MEPSCYEALFIPLGGGLVLRIEEDGPGGRREQPQVSPGLPDGWTAIESTRSLAAASVKDRSPFVHDPSAPERGLAALRLFEFRDYYWEVKRENGGAVPEVIIRSSLKGSADGVVWNPKETHGRFRVSNYLGSAWIEAQAGGEPPVRIAFEVASPKLDYEQEYRSMVEAIGAECQQLLLDWGTPTSLNVATDPDKRHETLLEQFLFLRHTLGPDKLDLYLETIARRPHSHLKREHDWKPAGSANPARFISDPLRYGRDWHRAAGGIRPGQIQEDRKFDSLDTPPNRFVKFALQTFRNLCITVLSAELKGKRVFGPDDTVALEAQSMLRSLDAFLANAMFDDVGDLQRIPFESTTLQRREGYREILLAWLMLDAAAQLEWPGRKDAYDGTTRDVATLYEYWLYFVLVRAFREELGMVQELNDPLAKVDGALPFCCRSDDGGLTINLKRREASFTRFLWEQDGRRLRVHFFFNRIFEKAAVGSRGSYTRNFRPDYSLVIVPEEETSDNWSVAEERAETSGRIAYLHFDAKYRGENLPAVFGEEDKTGDDDETTSVTSTAKNEDLYKMHTYNEAIRRTVGSYVLYPGTSPDLAKANAKFERYHEIIPGIGAFALRPKPDGGKPDGLGPVVEFIADILRHQLNKFTQSYRIDYWTESTIREQQSEYRVKTALPQFENLPPKDTSVLLGWVRDDTAADDCRTTLTFFCHGVEWDKTIPGKPGAATVLEFDPFRCHLFVAFNSNRTYAWLADIEEVKLVTAEARAAELKRPLSSMRAAYYFRVKLKNIRSAERRTINHLVPKRPSVPGSCRLSELALCATYP